MKKKVLTMFFRRYAARRLYRPIFRRRRFARRRRY